MSSINKLRWWLAPALFAGVLCCLFWRSFLPGVVHFNNDAPLGMLSSDWLQPNLSGQWDDLNYLGSNAGSASLDVVTLIRWALGPVGCAKFVAAIALWVLGTGAFFLFRALKLSPLATVLGALAAMLNSTFFSTACWGVASQEIAAGMIYFAAALVVGCQSTTPMLVRWTRLILAGLCVGMNVMEAADIGALYSILIALFVFVHALVDGEGTVLKKAFIGIGRVAVVAAFAGFIAYQAVFSLIGIGISGVAGTAQDTETKAGRWDWATQWSLPKAETVGLIVPGLFGYKMDTPKDMQPALQDAYASGVYWGGMGRDPNIDRYFDSGSQGQQPSGYMRFTGGGNYCGILVFLVAGWALAQSLRRQNSIFPGNQKHMILFLGVVTLLCLLLSWGRFAPFFYKIPYNFIPYFSTIRNPAKFLNFFSWALAIVFAYGVHGLNRRYLNITAMKTASMGDQVKNWWAKAGSFDRKWTFASAGLLVASALGWMIYSAQKSGLIEYLQKVGFGGTDPAQENSAAAIANFSIGQAGWFLVLFAIALGLLLLVIAGYFNGPRAKTGAVLLGCFLLFDMGRANLPWLVHWDYKQKYEVGSLNPVVDFLRKKPYENRVAYCLPAPLSTPQQFSLFDELYKIEWMQHHFPYYNIQSLDLVQNPRPPADMMQYEQAFQLRFRPAPNGGYEIVPESFPLAARKWQLTNTRYLLGPAGFLDELNQTMDPVQHRFQTIQRFQIVPKPGIERPVRLEELTAVPKADGDYALFEFTGALPRAKVYSNWQVNTNDEANLKTLADLNFDPAKTVLISTPKPELPAAATNDNSGSVDYQSYVSKHIVLSAKTTAPSVLLLNDKFDPQWRVTVDGRPAELLRCNFMMRGVYLPAAGTHTVDFQFQLPQRPLYVTLAAISIGIALCGFLAFSTWKRQTVSA
jgi:hypothetical protein